MEKQIKELIAEAKFDVNYYEKAIVTHMLNLQVTPDNTWDADLLKTCQRRLVQAEHRLKVLQEKIGEVEKRESIVNFLTA